MLQWWMHFRCRRKKVHAMHRSWFRLMICARPTTSTQLLIKIIKTVRWVMIRRKSTCSCSKFILCVFKKSYSERIPLLSSFSWMIHVFFWGTKFLYGKRFEWILYMCEVCRFASSELTINLHFWFIPPTSNKKLIMPFNGELCLFYVQIF